MSQDPLKQRPFNKRRSEDGSRGGSRDDQILALLNKLGERLIRSEKERIALKATLKNYDDKVDELESRSDNSEKVFLNLQNQLSRIEADRDDLETWQQQVEDRQRAQEEKLARTDLLTEQIEHAIAHQNRMARRMEKLIDDKMAMLKKLELIEATVTDTRKALESGDMTLLARPESDGEKKKSAGALMKFALGKPLGNDNEDLAAETEAAGKSLYLKGVSIVVLVALTVAGAWAVTQFVPRSQSLVTAQAPVETMAVNEVWGTAETLASQGAPVAESVADSFVNEPLPQPDAFYQDAQTLEQRFEEDADALAKELNEISPSGMAAPENIEEQGQAVKPESVAPVKDVAFTRTQKPKPFDVNAFIAAHTPKGSLSKRVQADQSLPEVVCKIEEKAFEGIPEAQHDLAAIYTAGHGGVTVDYERAATWFKEAAINGIANARYNLGVLYHQGLGVEKDINKAVGWYRAAAALDHPEAQYNLGIAHIEGVGASYNAQEAAKYFNAAAQGGILEAAYNLGLIYENGLLGTQNPENALFWYEYAARQGSPEAQTALEQLAAGLDMKLEEVDDLYDRMSKTELKDTPKKEARNTVEDKGAADAVKMAASAEVPAAAQSFEAAEYEYMPVPVVTQASAGPVASAAGERAGVIAQIQEQLIRNGFYPGPASGALDALTEDAIRAYQGRNDLAADGRATEALLVHMLTNEDGGDTLTATIDTLDAGQLRGDDFALPGAVGSREE